MDKMPIRSYTSIPYQILEPSMSSETIFVSQHGSGPSEGRHQSFDEHASTHGFKREHVRTPPPGALQKNFDPWMLDGPSCGSPLSTCSSLGPSEGIATPPSYTEQLPLPAYHLHEQRNQLCQENASAYASYRNVAEIPWDSQYPASNHWGAHSLVPNWTNNAYPPGLPLPATEPYIPSMPMVEAPVFSLPGPSHPITDHFTVDSAPFQLKAEDLTENSDSESEESADDDNSADSDASTNGPASKLKSRTQNPCFMMSKWDLSSMKPYDRQQSHSFLCPLTGQPDVKGKICVAKFARPEHCRRHVKTVHGEEKEYRCKVPICGRPFSRGDNLRDHYWTHLQRGGRIGKNDKMSLAELKEILGKSERKLIRILRQKMAKHKAKQVKLPVRGRL